MDDRVVKLEESVVSLVELLKQVLSLASANKNIRKNKG
jgi:hypothetical protein